MEAVSLFCRTTPEGFPCRTFSIVSLDGAVIPTAFGQGFPKIPQCPLFDVSSVDGLGADNVGRIPRAEHIRAIFNFADSLRDSLYRSTAGPEFPEHGRGAIIVRGMHLGGATLQTIRDEAPETLLLIKLQATLNPLMLELAFAEFFPPDVAKLLNCGNRQPVLFANRHKGRCPE